MKLVIGLLLLVGPCFLQAEPYHLDKAESFIRFQPSARFGNGSGQFHKFDAQADVDKEQPGNSRLSVTIDIASIDTGIKMRDKHLRTTDFFDTARHPTSTLQVTQILRARENIYQATTQLTLRGITKTLILPVIVSDVQNGLVVEGETTINRKDFNINYDSWMNPIKNEVKVHYRLVLRKSSR